MDNNRKKGREKYSEGDHEVKKKKKKKRKREKDEEKEGSQQASLAHSHGQHAEDEAALRRNEKNSGKQDVLAGDDPSQRISSEKRKKKDKKQHSALMVEELGNQRLVQENLHEANAQEHRSEKEQDERNMDEDIGYAEKIKKKKKKKREKNRENMDVDVNFGREIEKQQEQEEEQHSEEGDLLKDNDKGEKEKKRKKLKERRKDEGHAHFQEGNPLGEIASEEEERSGKEEKQRSKTPDHEQRKVKKARKSAKENGIDRAEGVVYKDEDCNDRFVTGKENASSKATKHTKKSKSSMETSGYELASHKAQDLSSSGLELSTEPFVGDIECFTNSNMALVSNPKEQEKGKKEERKRKRVTFQDQIDVADQQRVVPDNSDNSIETVEEIWGVRFTPEEDEILKDAVSKYIKSKGWDEQDGLNKVLNSKKHKDARNCWREIKLSLPHRPQPAVRFRAHVLLENGAHAGKWTAEEENLLKRLQEQHGRKWREISGVLNRHRTSIKEKWRILKRAKAKGTWTQHELQQLSDLVHRCLRAKASMLAEKKKPDRHILRDNINWDKIADSIGTHNHGSCCSKWYYNLQSSLVTEGLWANEDDFLLLQSLLESGAFAEEEVEWDSLLDHRPGQVCSTRWKQMVKHLGENRTRQFLDKLDILTRRYAPELLESSGNGVSIENDSLVENPSNSAEISDR